MSQYPPQPAGGFTRNYAQQPRKLSGAAVTSLVCGILSCFVITGIVAIITGILGLRATKNPNVSGRGLAIAGLILGILGTLGGGGCLGTMGFAIYMAEKEAKPGVALVDTMLNDAAKGDVDAVMTRVDPAYLPRPTIVDLVDGLKPLGQPAGFSKNSSSIRANAGSPTTLELTGTIKYPNTERTAEFVLHKKPDGSYIIVGFKVNG